tara:strand:+ start:442 stop:2400 length:1959 start_codon:yes stop_codon:yes gene_type:complete
VAKTEKLLLEIQIKNQQALGKINRDINKIQKSSFKLSTALKGAGVALAAVFAVRIGKAIIETTARFEDLNDALASVTGSAQAGGEAFGFIQNFATKTQFGVEDLTTTFIKLKASGIEPTEELLTLFTDTAAITTDQVGSLTAMTDLFARTTSGGLGLEELNRLVDRGVPVFKILEEQIGITRLQISEMGKTAEGSKKILNALSTGLRQEFGGATAKVVDNLSTQFSNLDIALKNSAMTFGEGLSPPLKEAVGDLTKFVENNEETIAALGRLGGAVLQGVVKLFVGFAKALGHVVVGGEKLIAFFKEVKNDTDDVSKDFSGLNSDLNMTGDGFTALLRDTDPVIPQLSEMAFETEELGNNLNDTINATLGLTDALGDYNENEGRTNAELLKEQADEAAAVNRETAIMNRTYPKTSESVKTANKALRDYRDNLTEMLEDYSTAVIITDTLTNMTRTFASTTESALTDVVMGTKTLQEALGQIGQAILRDLIGGMIRLFVVGPILEKLAQIFGKNMVDGVNRQVDAQKNLNRQLQKTIVLKTILAFLGGGFANGGAVGHANGGAIGYGGARASGGPVGGSNAFLVGERGPEMFIPNTAGRIVSNEASGASIGGEVNVNFNISATDASSFDSMLVQRRGLITNIINDALNRQGRRI